MVKTADDFDGVDIREVWNFRLSKGIPLIVRRDGSWFVEIWSKNNADYVDGNEPAKPLHVKNMGIPHEPGDECNNIKISQCFAYLYSIRDQYSLDHIELRKPVVAYIEKSNQVAATITESIQDAIDKNEKDRETMLRGRLAIQLEKDNEEIKRRSLFMHAKIKEATE